MIKSLAIKRFLRDEIQGDANPDCINPGIRYSWDGHMNPCLMCPLCTRDLKKKIFPTDYRRSCDTVRRSLKKSCYGMANWALATLILEHMPEVLTIEKHERKENET